MGQIGDLGQERQVIASKTGRVLPVVAILDLGKPLIDVSRVLSRELDDFDRIPDDVIATDRLEPKSLNAERSASDFGVPNEKAGRERLAVDLGPASRIDQSSVFSF
jgi:hypothetical protein